MNFNSVTLLGRLAANPNFIKGKKEDGSDDRTWTRLAVNRPSEDGKADFVPIVAWGARARVLAEFGKKGKEILVRGSIRTNNELQPDGSYKNYTEVSIAEIILGADSVKSKNAQSPVVIDDMSPPVVSADSPSMVDAMKRLQNLTPEGMAQLTAMVAAGLVGLKNK
jgi:single-stranded DNA-binding protein